MPTLANTLLEFILNLLRDPDAAHAFREDPERELEHAGLSDVCSDDVDAIMPVVLDFAPVGVGASFDREYNTGDNSSRIDHNNPGETTTTAAVAAAVTGTTTTTTTVRTGIMTTTTTARAGTTTTTVTRSSS
jgi:hypothetical protein